MPPGLLPPLADVEQGHGGPALCACLEDLAGKAAAAGLAVSAALLPLLPVPPPGAGCDGCTPSTRASAQAGL